MKPTVPSTATIDVQSQEAPFVGRSTLRLVTFRHQRFDGRWSDAITWELWQRGRAAAMLPYDPVRDLVVMIEQFRLPSHAAGFPAVMREIPAGLCEASEDAEATIRREMIEEAGIAARRSLHVGDYLLSPGASDETITLFAGEVDASEIDTRTDLAGLRDSNEDIRVIAVPADAAIEDAVEGRLPNSVATIGLLWLAVRRPRLQALWR